MKNIKDIAIDSGASAIGAGVGVVFAGPPGAIIGAVIPPVLSDVLHRMLSQKEKSRIEEVAKLATQKIQEKIKNGAKPTTNAKGKKIKELFEGTLLKAKEAYEAKKIPLFANLFANAPFTNTPFENLNQTLIFAEQLSYQQLCILSLLGNSLVGKELGLSKEPFSKQYKNKFDERTIGIYQDVAYMMQIGIIAEKVPGSNHLNAVLGGGLGNIVPNNLVLLGTGMLLFNGLQLDFIEKVDTQVIRKALS